jgi:hypothetical protein
VIKQVDKATLVQLMGVSVVAVEAHTPRKVMFVHSDNRLHKFWTFGKHLDVWIVLIPVIQPTEIQDYEYIKDSHKKDFAQLTSSTAEMVTIPLKPGQIMVHHSGLIFKSTLKTGEVCAMFIYKLSADRG